MMPPDLNLESCLISSPNLVTIRLLTDPQQQTPDGPPLNLQWISQLTPDSPLPLMTPNGPQVKLSNTAKLQVVVASTIQF